MLRAQASLFRAAADAGPMLCLWGSSPPDHGKQRPLSFSGEEQGLPESLSWDGFKEIFNYFLLVFTFIIIIILFYSHTLAKIINKKKINLKFYFDILWYFTLHIT